MKIQVKNLHHHFRTKPVLDDVTFEIPEGDLVAVMGPNGMGKSTLVKSIAGVLTPISGEIRIDEKVRRSSVAAERAIRKQVAYLPDHPWLPVRRSGRELLFDMGEIYDVPVARIFDHSDRLLDLFELKEKANSSISSYSNGQKKKIALAATLITDAPILLLDEPFTGGLDPSGIHALKQVLHNLAKRSDVTVVMASQIPEIVETVAARILVMKDGKLIANGSLEELRAQTNSPDSSLSDILETLINSETSSRIDRYFE